MTDKFPFREKSSPYIYSAITRGELPQRPTEPEVVARGLDDRLWQLLLRCWTFDYKSRPSIQQVIDELDGIEGQHKTSFSALD
jgi:hypothetical protein